MPEPSFANRTVQGLAWALVSGFAFALLAVLNRRYSAIARRRRHRVLAESPGGARAAAVRGGRFAAALGSIGAREIALLLVLGLFCTALAHTLFIASLSRLSAHTASTVAALEPVYGIALAALLLGEIPGLAPSRAAR